MLYSNWKKSKRPSFWIHNQSNVNVSLRDLDLTIPAGRSYDLLSKHFHFTPAQINLSVESGSIFNKRDKIILRDGPPISQLEQIEVSSQPMIRKLRSSVKLTEEHYEELIIPDEDYMAEIIALQDAELPSHLIPKK